MAPLLQLALILFFCCFLADAGKKKEPKPDVAISKFNPGGQYVMLTFDDGPHYGVTSRVLDILREKKVKATFFLMGSQLRKSPQLVQRIYNEGHDIQNNGWKRTSAPLVDVRQLGGQVNHTSHVIESLLANTTRIGK
jgi:peptidoglycan/xylan/chitin deacetylase (PgdA/CDA1 family)